jgi:hypothetical protein
MMKANLCESTRKRIQSNMGNSCANSLEGPQNIGVLLIGSGGFLCGSNFQVFAWFTHVGTSNLVPFLGPLDARQCFTDEGFREALRRGSEAFVAADGPEQQLPDGMTFTDPSGHVRRKVRIRWWDPRATTFKLAAIGIDDMLDALPDLELPPIFRYLENTPVLFGHYWMPGEPRIAFPTAACLDFSVARNGYLTAYRWSGERELSNEHLVYVPAEAV